MVGAWWLNVRTLMLLVKKKKSSCLFSQGLSYEKLVLSLFIMCLLFSHRSRIIHPALLLICSQFAHTTVLARAHAFTLFVLSMEGKAEHCSILWMWTPLGPTFEVTCDISHSLISFHDSEPKARNCLTWIWFSISKPLIWNSYHFPYSFLCFDLSWLFHKK